MVEKRKKTRSTSSSVDPTTRYAMDVTSGKEIAGPDIRNSCKRHLKDLESCHARGLVWDTETAQRAIDFFAKVLKLNGGEHEGKPFNLLPWQCFIVGSVFGWQNSDGYRRFRMVYVESGKGSGKSPLAAGIALYCLVADKEPRAEVYAAATKKDQAMILFRDAVAMVDQSPALAQRINKSGGAGKEWNLAFLQTGSFFRPISSDDGQSGPRPHCALITAKRIAGALRAMNGADVTVNINSPGGDMFEGLAIYNLLREYQGKVTVKVLGIAASAASVIAMAGDDIQIGRGAFLMIHNCWVVAMGNRHDFAELSASLEPFDNAMADIYAARSGLDMASVQKLMDAESYIGGSDAVEKGLADSLLSADAVSDGDETPAAALRKLDALLAKTSTPRSERRKLIKALSGGMSGAATNHDGTPGAAEEIKPEIINSLENALAALVK